MDKIGDLASKINVGQIEKDTESQKLASGELLKSAEKVELYLPGTLAELNRTQNMLDAAQVKNDELAESFSSIKSKNTAVTEELANVSSLTLNIQFQTCSTHTGFSGGLIRATRLWPQLATSWPRCRTLWTS